MNKAHLNFFKVSTCSITKYSSRFLLVFLGFICFPGMLNAQVLERISVTERGDQLGYVVRYHLTEPVDSFVLAQVEQHRLQMVLYSSRLIVSDDVLLPEADIIRDARFFDLEGALGVEFILSDDKRYGSNAYLDINRRDLLLALTELGQDEVFTTETQPLFMFQEEDELRDEQEKAEPPADDEQADVIIREAPSGMPEIVKTHRRVFPGDPMEFYLRWAGEDEQHARIATHLNYSGSSHLRLSTLHRQTHPWDRMQAFTEKNRDSFETGELVIFDPVLFTSYNSDYPTGGNDGALWQGRGFNTAISVGAGYRYNFLEMVLRPVFVSSDNRDFDLSPTPPYQGLSPFAMAQTYSDIPQRFGTDGVNRFDLGESYLKASYSGWAAGISNERFRTGPAIHNPLLFGYNAPGFFHFFAGTDAPFEALYGQFQTRIFWGGLRDSGYFYDEEVQSNQSGSRYITGFTLNYNPDFLTGLHIGFTRTAVSYVPDSGIGLPELLMAFQRSQDKLYDIPPKEARFTKSAFFIRWHFPETGFEAYAEWGRNDNRRTLRDIITEPELNSGYVLGFIKRFHLGTTGRLTVNGEITNLENSAVTAQSRDFNIWYTHPVIQQGFTHRGQVLGAPIGPGSNTQQLHIAYYDRFGKAGFTLGRIAHHNDRLFKNFEFYEQSLARPWMTIRMIQETEMFGALHGLLFLPGGFELEAALRYGVIENRNNQYTVDTSGGVTQRIFFDEPNVNFSFTIRYSL